jgi:predicted naringenin-chalcone synthase
MESCISAIGIANPHNRIAQQDIYHFMVNAFGLDKTNAARLKSIYDHSGIDYRYSVIPRFWRQRSANYTFFDPSES